mmetsp:Transcript_125155/g.359431  ORF Transcript_125155/g.359431 Transcript_125155/m.359431 type:complete len:259 (-) Transcript_125155:159-935(-)
MIEVIGIANWLRVVLQDIEGHAGSRCYICSGQGGGRGLHESRAVVEAESDVAVPFGVMLQIVDVRTHDLLGGRGNLRNIVHVRNRSPKCLLWRAEREKDSQVLVTRRNKHVVGHGHTGPLEAGVPTQPREASKPVGLSIRFGFVGTRKRQCFDDIEAWNIEMKPQPPCVVARGNGQSPLVGHIAVAGHSNLRRMGRLCPNCGGFEIFVNGRARLGKGGAKHVTRSKGHNPDGDDCEANGHEGRPLGDAGAGLPARLRI